ncbi:MAG: hypothetical protein E7369_05205 [Clostridiales bacterium]|nr:hypothetical protein [Clostridiales bacterium]
MKKFLNIILAITLALTFCVLGVGCKDDDTPPSQEVEVDESDYTVYYFDGNSGKDSNSGISQMSPKKSLSEISKIVKNATAQNPIKILLKCGSTFDGRLILANFDTTAEKPLIVSSYGDIQKGRPKLVGRSLQTDTAYSVVLVNDDNVRISNLEVTDPYAYQGIFFAPTRAGAMKNIYVENCYIHDVNFFWDEDKHDPNNPPSTLEGLAEICPSFTSTGNSYGRRYYRNYGGLIFSNATTVQIGASWYENVYAKNNVIERVARTGIYITTRWNNCPGVGYGENKFVEESDRYNDAENGIGYFMHRNVNFIDNKLDVIGGDGIILAGIDSVLQGNVCYRANYLGCGAETSSEGLLAPQYFNAAIWVYDSYNVLFQYNEAGYTFLRNGAGDGEGFDIDISCEKVYFQYNYAHHNEGGGLLICNNTSEILKHDKDGNVVSPNGRPETALGVWKNNYALNNVFAFNGLESNAMRSAFITVARECHDFKAYNNTVIFSNAYKGRVEARSLITCEDQKASLRHEYANNVFILADDTGVSPIAYNNGNLRGAVYTNNLYYNTGNLHQAFATPDTSPILNVNPSITLPSNYDGFDTVASFKGGNAELFGLGISLQDMLKKDILGKTVNSVNYVGAFAG